MSISVFDQSVVDFVANASVQNRPNPALNLAPFE